MIPRSPSSDHPRSGVALVIVLAFVVLITGLIVAYFARSVTGRQLSNSSAGQTKASLLAQSASDIVISGLKREIAAGSTVAIVSPSPNPSPGYQSTVYTPLSTLNAMPVRYPTPAPSGSNTDPIPNLVRWSSATDSAIPAPGVPSLASAIHSDTNPAINGRAISPARWNSHFLIPRIGNTSDADSKPDPGVNFVAPDWVLMTRSGPAIKTNVGSGPTALNNPAASNQNYVIGRYAYAIYDEGGLLDMNVAGHPSVTTPPAATGFTATQAGRRGSLALADLTYLPVVANPSVDHDNNLAQYLLQAQVDRFVGWRNYAAANKPTGPFPNFVFSSSNATSWFTNFANYNTNGYMKVYSPALATGATDQALLSRQELLRLRSSIGFSPNVLQYMGTFSRSLDQPSFIPAHIQYPNTAPYINQVGSSAPPLANNADKYQGNNDAAGTVTIGTTSVAAQDLINPSFLTVRAASAFTRLDSTKAIIGEPLVKRRFSLNRLSWLTYKGPSANNLTDPNVQQAITAMGGDPSNPSDPIYMLVAQGTTANIQNYFGLSWSGGIWTYAHGSPSGGPIIMTLPQVAAANREPDFMELLKAAANAGSLAKGAPNLNYSSGTVLNYQYTLDTSLDYNVLQLAANLLDQFDTDSYPTVIRIPGSTAAGAVVYDRFVRGVEDLPYFYRYHPFTVVTRLPSPLLSASSKVQFVRGTDKPIVDNCQPATGTTISDPGQGVLLWAADVWNPHDPNSINGTKGTRPPTFRLTVLTCDPAGQTLSWASGARPRPHNDFYDLIPPLASVTPLIPYSTLSETTTAFTFSDNGGTIFREPTLLWRGDAPSGANLTPIKDSVAGPYVDINTGVSYCGVFIGKAPLMFTAPVTTDWKASPADPNNNYLFQCSGNMDPVQTTPVGSYRQYTFRLEYLDPTDSTHWIIYDEKYPDLHGLTSPRLVVNKLDWPNDQYQNAMRTSQVNDDARDYDPRVGRFGIGITGGLDIDGIPLLESQAVANYKNTSTAGNDAMGASKFTVFVTGRPQSDRGNKTKYSGPCQTSDPGKMPIMRMYSGLGWNSAATDSRASTWPEFYAGLLSQNNPANTVFARNNSNSTQIYYEDADGLARRAMGAYADVLTPSVSTTTSASGIIGLPEATANTFGSSSGFGVGTATSQSQSRPLIINRPFRSVAEMSYASRGAIWKQIDFFTPESGDTALLDTFCINDPPPTAIVAGKVNLNTHQTPVLKAIIAGSYRDDVQNYSGTPPSYALNRLTGQEADQAAKTLYGITSDLTHVWRGPFANIGDMVGRLVPNPATALGASDVYTYQASTANGAVTGVAIPPNSYTYAGLSAALDKTVYVSDNTTTTPSAKIQRMRETPIRPLSDGCQTRVWNLMIDVIAQTGRYPTGLGNTADAGSLSQFSVDGEKRYWVHVAIDRNTGEIIDRQTEEVSE